MNEILMTVQGNVVDDPSLHETKSGHRVANFRLASTSRRYDRDEGRWVDGSTFFVSVSAWRNLGENAAVSLKKGQPVVVYGRYQTRTYEVNETTRVSQELEAIAIGHDLNRGTSVWNKLNRGATSHEVETDERGIPENPAANWLTGPPVRQADPFDGELAGVGAGAASTT